jgi:exopolysaccharide biosynthesis protein
MISRGESSLSKRISANLIYRIALVAFSVFVLLDTFVIPRAYSSSSDGQTAQATAALRQASATSSSGSGQASVTDSSYCADGLSITITTTRYENTTVYVADIVCDDVSDLQTAFANNTYGKNVTAQTSAIAQQNGAILAINGDYYGAQNAGYVIRNGVLYRDTAASATQEDLVIYADGSFEVISEGTVSAAELLNAGAWQVLSFGPGLVEDSTIAVGENDEVDKAMASNPRTALGQIGKGHYVMVVADGRTDESTGLSLYQLAQFMQNLGVETAYNLDGGGSSTLYFNGSIVNNPTSGRGSSERKVSDIVYIGA